MPFGEKLQTLRKAKDLSQDQLITQLNVFQQTVSKWELGVSYTEDGKHRGNRLLF